MTQAIGTIAAMSSFVSMHMVSSPLPTGCLSDRASGYCSRDASTICKSEIKARWVPIACLGNEHLSVKKVLREHMGVESILRRGAHGLLPFGSDSRPDDSVLRDAGIPVPVRDCSGAHV